MTTRTTASLVKAAAVVGLAVGLAFGGGFGTTGAQDDTANNHFASHPGSVGGQTGIDPHDPYAPIDLVAAGIAFSATDNARSAGLATATAVTWDEETMAPQPGLPGRPY